MSDVIGPGTFNGAILLVGCAAIVLLFAAVMLIGAVTGRRRWLFPAAVVVVVNAVVAVLAYEILDGSQAGVFHGGADWIDWCLLPDMALSIAGFYVRVRAPGAK